jgi:hypothetical protein
MAILWRRSTMSRNDEVTEKLKRAQWDCDDVSA